MARSCACTLLLGAALALRIGAADATLTLVGGTETHFAGFDAPPVATSVQSSGLQDTLIISDSPLDAISLKYLGSDAGHDLNQFYINSALIFDTNAVVLSSYGTFFAGSPLAFKFKDASDGSAVSNGGNLLAYASYVVLGTFDTAGAFTPYTKNGEFSYVLGFNDGQRIDADYDDLVVGIRLGAALTETVPEPATISLVLCAFAAMSAIERRRRRA